MHPHKVGGLAAEGTRGFSNANVRVNRCDADLLSSPSALSKGPTDRQGIFIDIAASLGPYADLGRFQPFYAPANLLPGIRATPVPGHTPGHTMYPIRRNR